MPDMVHVTLDEVVNPSLANLEVCEVGEVYFENLVAQLDEDV